MTSCTYGSGGGIEVLSNQGPVSYLTRALQILEQSLGPLHPNTQQGRKNYAILLRAMGRDDEAKQIEEDNDL